MGQVIAHAPAKVNLALEVEALEVEVPPAGVSGVEMSPAGVSPVEVPEAKAPAAEGRKHRLSSVFCTTTLADTLVFDFASSGAPFSLDIAFKSAGPDISFISAHNNTLTKTLEQFERVYGPDLLPSGTLRVELIKSIPLQAGLGGGSTDAAALLRMLCWLARREPLSEPSLAVAKAVGADVPFFLHAAKAGLCAHMGGYGDELLAELPKPELPLCLFKPPGGVSTKKAYEMFDAQELFAEGRGNGEPGTKRLVSALVAKRPPSELAPLCINNMEPAATALLPEIGSLKASAAALSGVLCATMSGSGSALFALCASLEAAHTCMQHYANKGLWAVAVTT